jgi:hypothetical protein
MAWMVGLVGGWAVTWRPRLARAAAGDERTGGSLSPAEIEDLIAFAEIVVEGRPLAPAARADLLAHIEDRLERRPESVELYRTTVRLLERLAGRRFSALDAAARLELVGRHRLAVPDVRPSESLGRFADEVRTVRSRVVRDVIGGYYASPSGWAVVGYAVFPGRCGELTRYTRPEI